MIKFILTMKNAQYDCTVKNLDAAIKFFMPLLADLHEGERVEITSAVSKKIHYITLRRGRSHWQYPGYQFGSVAKTEIAAFKRGQHAQKSISRR
jgi:hypothetical protein